MIAVFCVRPYVWASRIRKNLHYVQCCNQIFAEIVLFRFEISRRWRLTLCSCGLWHHAVCVVGINVSDFWSEGGGSMVVVFRNDDTTYQTTRCQPTWPQYECCLKLTLIFANQHCGSRSQMFSATNTRIVLPRLYWTSYIHLRCSKVHLKVIHPFSCQPVQVTFPRGFPHQNSVFLVLVRATCTVSPSQPPRMLCPISTMWQV
jgi:hypothetical protein